MKRLNGMKNDLEQKQIIQKAIARAERMIRSEQRLTSLKAHNAPESVITHEREIIGENMGTLASDELAERLLPQARNIAAMRDDRLRYLSSNTFLGSCKTRFEDLFIDFAHQEGEVDQFETKEEALDVLERAIRSGNQLTIVGTIANILDFIEQDLVYRDEDNRK